MNKHVLIKSISLIILVMIFGIPLKNEMTVWDDTTTAAATQTTNNLTSQISDQKDAATESASAAKVIYETAVTTQDMSKYTYAAQYVQPKQETNSIKEKKESRANISLIVIIVVGVIITTICTVWIKNRYL